MSKKLAGGIFTGLLLLYFLSLVVYMSAGYEKYQWDFRTHRQAGKIFASGSNPYDPKVLIPGAGTRLPYTYPPVTLFFYQLFSLPSYKTAFHIFLFLKCILLVGLVYFWKREFLQRETSALFYLFCLLAFNSEKFLDILAGNINLLEQIMLWLAFYYFLKQRLLLFCTFTIIAASFKMVPVLFLFLLLLSEDKKKYIYLLGSGMVFLIYLLLQYAISPHLFVDFVRNALSVVSERGIIVPSTYTLISDVFKVFAQNTGVHVPQSIPLAIVGILAAATILLSYRAYILLRRSKLEEKEKVALFLVCFVYALIHPRFKDYAYMLLLVPTYFMITNARYIKAFPFILVLFFLSSPPWTLPGSEMFLSFFWEYYPLMIAYCVWGIYLYEIYNYANEPIEPSADRKI
jgi:hypothetical protein